MQKIHYISKIWYELTQNSLSLNSLFIHQNPRSWQWSNIIQNGASILNTALAWPYHSGYVLQTGSKAHLLAFHIRCLCDWWHRLVHLPLFSPQSWFIRLVSLTWHWHCPPLLLWKLPVGTFTIIWSPDGQKHQTETYTRAHTLHCLITLTLGLCQRAGEPPTASTLKGSLTQRAQLLGGPEG